VAQQYGCFLGKSTVQGLWLALRRAIGLTLLAGLAAVSLSATGIIEYQVTDLGAYQGTMEHELQYDFVFSGIDLVDNPPNEDYELDVDFDQSVFGELCSASNTACTGPAPEAGTGVMLSLLNSPPGAPDQYSMLATVNDPSLTGTFSVAALLVASGQPSGVLTDPLFWQIVDDDNNFVQISSGYAEPVGDVTPEPSTFSLCGLGLLLGSRAVRRRLGGSI
jgi:hypothetical protein